jgi:hypothetical protein
LLRAAEGIVGPLVEVKDPLPSIPEVEDALEKLKLASTQVLAARITNYITSHASLFEGG